MNIKKIDVLVILGSLISFVLFFVLLRDISTGHLIQMQTKILGQILIETQGFTIFETLFSLISPFLLPFLGLAFLVLGFVILAFYGKQYQNHIGILIGAISAVLSLLFFSFSLVSIFVGISLFVSCIYILPLANTYFKEFKKWKKFRLGSRTVSTILLIFNIVLAVGVFTEVHLNSEYKENYKEDLTDTITQIGARSTPMDPTGQIDKETIKEAFEKKIKDSPLVESAIRLLPLTIAAMVWVILEFLRTIILGNLGGGLSYIILRFSRT